MKAHPHEVPRTSSGQGSPLLGDRFGRKSGRPLGRRRDLLGREPRSGREGPRPKDGLARDLGPRRTEGG
jgi:hypothetical protein